MGNRITYDVGFKVDGSGLQSLKNELTKLSQFRLDDMIKINPKDAQQKLDGLHKSVQIIQQALNQSYNFKLDSTNILEFRRAIDQSGMSIQQLQQNFANAGLQGQLAFKQLTTDLLTSNTQLKSTYNLLDSIGKTLGNTLKWSIASGAINGVSSSIRDAWSFAQKLDTSLNDIRIVTGKSAEEMDKFADRANRAAKGLGTATTNYTNASLIFYQQGLSDKDVEARTEATIKAANVTGQSAAEVSEQLTAVWNGYKVVAEEAELYVDKLAAVAASTAADLEELSTGMSKVASAASTMGVDIDQLSAQLSTIVSVTRQDASLVGTALKTIYARMGDLQVEGVDEFGTSLGDVSGQLRQMGIDVLDQEGNLRDMGTVIEEVADKWGTWTSAQQQAAAVAIAGKRQYNNLIALFENWDMYESALKTSEDAEGTLQKQQDTYMDSIKASLKELSTAGERVSKALFDNEGMKGLIDTLTVVVDLFGNFTESIGGGALLLTHFGSILMRIFNRQITDGISTFWTNMTGRIYNSQAAAMELKQTYELIATAESKQIPGLQAILGAKQEQLKYAKLLTNEQKIQWDNNIKALSNAQDQVVLAKEEKKAFEAQKVELEELLKLHKMVEDTKGKKYDINTEEGRQGTLKQVEKRRKDIDSSEGLQEDVEETLAEPETELNRAKKVSELSDYSNENVSEFIKGYTDNSAEGQAAIEKLKNAQDDLTTAVNLYKEALERGESGEEEYLLVKEEATTVSKLHKEAIDRERTAILQMENGLKKLPKEQDRVNNGLLKAQQNLERASLEYKRFTKEIKSKAVINQITSVTTAIMQMGSAISSIMNLSDIWSDEDLSDGEKVLQTFQNLGMTIPQVMMGLTALKTAFTGFKKAQESATLVSKMFSLEEQKQLLLADTATTKKVLQTMTVVSANELEEKSVEDLVKSLNKEQIAQVTANLLKTQAAAASGANAAALGTEATAYGTAGTAGSAAGWSIQAAWWPILLIGLAILAVFAAVAAIYKAVTTAEATATEKAQKKLEEVQEQAKVVREEFQSLKEEFSKILEEMNKYKDATTALDKMRKGTEEWQEAVSELNMQVMDLVSKYPLLLEYLKVSSDGVYQIEQEGWTQLVNEKRQQIVKQQSLVAAMDLSVSHQDRNKEKLKLQDELYKGLGYESMTSYGVSKSDGKVSINGIQARDQDYTYVTLEDFLEDPDKYYVKDENGYETINPKYQIEDGDYDHKLLDKGDNKLKLYEALGATIEQYKDGTGTEHFERFSATFSNDSAVNLLHKTDEELAEIEKLIDAMDSEEEKKEIRNLINTLKDNNSALELNQQKIDAQTKAYLATLAEQKGLDKETYTDLVGNDIFTENINTDVTDYRDKLLLKEDDNRTYFKNLMKKDPNFDFDLGSMNEEWIHGTINTSNDMRSAKAYVEAMYKYATGKEVTVSAQSLNNIDVAEIGAYEFTDADGNKVKFDSILNQAAQKYMENTIGNVTKGSTGKNNEEVMKDLKDKGISQSAAYFLNDNAALLSNGTIDWASGTLKNMQDLSSQKYINTITELYGEEVAKSYTAGITDYETIFKKNATATLEKNKFSQKFVEDLNAENSTLFDNFTQDDFTQFSVNLQKMGSLSGGNGAVTALMDVVKNKGDADLTKKVNDLMSQTDFSDVTSLNNFRSQLLELGINLEGTNAAWDAFVANVSSGNKQWISNQQQVIDNLAKIKELTTDLSAGDIISIEDFQTLRAIAPEIASMFIKTADGMKAIASGEEINKALTKQYKGLKDISSEYENIREAAKGLTGDSYFKTDEFRAKSAEEIVSYFGADQLGVAKALGINGNDIINQLSILQSSDSGSAEYVAAEENLANWAAQINQAVLDAQNGAFSSETAEEIWATSIAESWDEVNESNISAEVKTKAEKMWRQTYLSALGFSDSFELGLYTDELESQVKSIRQLELDYFQDINNELDILGQKINVAFGSSALSRLDEQIALRQANANRANQQSAQAKSSFETMKAGFLASTYSNFGVEGNTLLNADGSLNLEALRNLQSNYDETDDRYLDIENLILMWDKVDNAAAQATEAAYALIDAQIERFNYEYEMQRKLINGAKELAEFSRQFNNYVTELTDETGKVTKKANLKAFGDQSATELIENAFDDYYSNKTLFKSAESALNQVQKSVQLYSDNIDNYNAAQTTVNENQKIIDEKNAVIAAAQAEAEKAKEALAAENDRLAKIATLQENAQTAINTVSTASSALSAAQGAVKTQKGIIGDENSGLTQELNNKKTAYSSAKSKFDNRKNDSDKKDLEKAMNNAKDAQDASQAKLDEANKKLNEATKKQTAAQDVLNKAEAAKNESLKKYAEALGEDYEKIKTDKNNDSAAIKKYLDNIYATQVSSAKAAGEAAIAAAEAKADSAQTEKEAAETQKAAAETTRKTYLDKILYGEDGKSKNLFATEGDDGSLIWNEAAISENWESFLEEGKSALEEMQAALQNLYDGFLSAQAELMQNFDDNIEKLKTMNNILSGSADLWKLIGKQTDNYSNKLSSYYNQITANTEQAYYHAEAKLSVAQIEYDKVQQLIKDGTEVSDEMLATVTNNLSTATEDVMSTVKEWMSALSNEFAASMTTTIDNFVGGLETVKEEWELTVAKDDRYLDDVNAIYEQEQLIRNIQQSIDETDNYTAQKKLMDLRIKQEEKLKEIAEGKAKLTQYELDRENALYELELKKIALEEAQQTANKMKLTRDAMGNYTYQYVADEDAIAKAEEELAAAENELYNLDKDRNKKLVDEYYSTMTEANSAITEAMAAGDMERVKRLKEYYFNSETGLLAGIQSELKLAESNLQKIGSQLLGSNSWSSSLSDFTSAITNSELGTLADNIDTLLGSEEDGSGILGSFKEISNTIDSLLQSDGLLQTSIDSVKETMLDVDELTNRTIALMDASEKVLEQLPSLVLDIASLEDALSSQGQNYQDWLQQQVDNNFTMQAQTEAMLDNTAKIEVNTQALQDMKNVIEKALPTGLDDIILNDTTGT